MSREDRQDLLAKVGDERRDFLKKIAIAAAFAAPTIATFSLDGMRKKAFAQSAYDAPVVLSFVQGAAQGQAVVTFSQRMDTGVGTGNDAARVLAGCRETSTNPSHPGTWSWNGDTMQVFHTTNSCPDEDFNVHVTYNMGSCGVKFRGANGIELLPFSGMVTISGYCG